MPVYFVRSIKIKNCKVTVLLNYRYSSLHFYVIILFAFLYFSHLIIK